MNTRSKALPQLAMWLTITTFIAGIGYVISQQVLRMSANDPQIQLAEDGMQRLANGEDPSRIVPELRIDVANSLAPFVIIYDNVGHVVVSSATLDGFVPAPPKGVFEFVRGNREERVTWQPRHGVRIAAIVTRSGNGFVLAGRNMREIEARETLVFKLAMLGWLAANIALLVLWWLARMLSGPRALPVQTAA